ncbi:uncharacterized protein LOC125234906 [Leguminivora glycinivorella]|uniref:uncharacterized protein LOC125234906 n=1 Tax=Leguminivora glycinivorella TaxID=1035111 RepID=UPI00200E0026|nr:uncharacterized protein LOC125234906 [Leguminivora glycinivorella]
MSRWRDDESKHLANRLYLPAVPAIPISRQRPNIWTYEPEAINQRQDQHSKKRSTPRGAHGRHYVPVASFGIKLVNIYAYCMLRLVSCCLLSKTAGGRSEALI